MATHVPYCSEHSHLVPFSVAEALERERQVPLNATADDDVEPMWPEDNKPYNLRRKRAEEAIVRTALPDDSLTDGSDAHMRMTMYSCADLEKMYAKFCLACSDSERKERVRLMGVALTERGGERRLRGLSPAWRIALDALEGRFPHFAKVVDYLRVCFALAEANGAIPRLEPILLAGGPGVGKSFFAQHLAELLGAGFEVVRMESAQSSSVLGGSADFWSNTQPGKVFDALMLGDYANPTFYLDEIDKVNPSMTYDPLAPLYALLQPETARAFADASFPNLKMDASRITWVMTCNDPGKVPAPLLSRMVRFDIDAPGADHARSIATAVVNALLAELAPATTGMLFQDGAIDRLTLLSPRQMQQSARAAIGRCVLEKRAGVSAMDIGSGRQPEGRRIGFM